MARTKELHRWGGARDEITPTIVTCRGLREDETRWRTVFPAHAKTGGPHGPFEACPLMRTHAR
jgi:hypothetical protein